MTHDHLDSDSIASYAAGRLDAAARAVIETHLADCATCRGEVLAVRGLLGSERRRLSRLAMPIAAVATLALVGSLLLRERPSSSEDTVVLRPGAGSEGLDSLAVWYPRPSGTVTPTELRFAWGANGADATYDLAVTDSTGAPVWRVRTQDTTAVPPATAALVPGATYHWWVDVLLRDGRIATTGVHEFVIAR